MRRTIVGLALYALVILCALPGLAEAAVGRTAGNFVVSPTGAATYTIPLWTPPGPHGLQPQLALTYNSQSGNGDLGVGWSLAGLSSIYRCNKTYAQDGAPGAVTLATSDGLCMDGQRLRLTGGTYGEAGSTYQTEIANFANVTAYGSYGNGPAYFVVQQKNGLIYEYGNPASNSYAQVEAGSSGTASMWMLDKVTDRAGNTMTIAYCPLGTPGATNCPSSALAGATVPSSISWTPTSYGVTTYAYTAVFNYGSNAAPPTGYQAGTVVNNPYLLNSIQIEYSGTTVKDYFLAYQPSNTTGRDLLQSLTECADSGESNCLAPTTITYQAGAAGVGSANTLYSGSSSGLVASYDFDGDGRTDIAYYASGDWWVAFGTSSGYSTPVNTGITYEYAIFDSVDGTGIDDILVPQSGYWHYYKWNGSSFAGTSTAAAVVNSAAGNTAIADIDGDGRPDLVSIGANGDLYVQFNTTSSGTVTFGSTINEGFFANNSGYYSNVFSSSKIPWSARPSYSGSGSQDVFDEFCLYNLGTGSTSCETLAIEYNGSSIVTYAVPGNNTFQAAGQATLDFNDDGCADLVSGGEVIISACNGQPGATITLPSGYTALAGMDWDGSGRESILATASSGLLYVFASEGTAIDTTPISVGLNCSSCSLTAIHNATGDGQDALLIVDSSGIQYFLHNGSGQPPDLLSQVTDGYGNSASPTYVPLAQASDYEENWNTATYPYLNFIGPIYVVKEAVFSDPSNPSGTYNFQYAYYGGWFNLQGRGFADFGVVNVTDSRNDVIHSKGYKQSFPYTGLVSDYDTVAEPSGNTLRYAVASSADTLLSSTEYQERYFPYFSNWAVYNYEYLGAESGDLISAAVTYYTYDDYGNATNVTRTITDDDPGSPYNGATWTTGTVNSPDVDGSNQAVDLDAWCLGLNDGTVVTYSATLSGSNTVTRTTDFTPDSTASNCRTVATVTEPSSSTYKVTESYGFDSFGNVNSDTVTGVGMSGRTTTANWGTTGQFPINVTDPTGAETQFGYDYSFGLISSLTDPNGLTTSWQYGDGFGRKTQETRPDGTYTVWAYPSCSQIGQCDIGNNTPSIQHYLYNTDGSLESAGTINYDAVDRPYFSTQLVASSQVQRLDIRYDSLGRVAQKAAPCFFTSATTPCQYWTTYTYDAKNRLTALQRPINQNDSDPQTTTYVYMGDTETITDPNDHATTLVRDVNGWPRETKDPYGYTVMTAYDGAGSKTAVTDSLGHTLWSGTWAYGVAPFNTQATDADLGSWSYTYDALGERIAWTDAKNQSFGESYDALGRPAARTEPDYFTHWTWGSTPSYHNVGKLSAVCTGTGTDPTVCTSSGYAESETYDSDGRLSQRAIVIPNDGTFNYTWAYNATTGLLDTLTYPMSTSGYSLKLQYAYWNGILGSITDVSDSPNVTVWELNTTDAAGHVTEESFGNGIVTSRTYDAVTGWLGALTAGVGSGSTVQNQGYLYGLTGAVSQRQDNNLGLTENFNYDDDYRLTSSTLNSTQNLSITYDDMGDITSRSDVASGATWTYGSSPHLHAVTQAGSSSYTYGYDANGNATSRDGQTIAWSSYNYPISIGAGTETVALAYGPGRQRWQQNYNSGTEITNYIGALMEQVGSGGIDTYRYYVYAGSEPVAVYSRTSTLVNAWNYFLLNQQGSIAAITNSSGAVDVNENFAAYGARRNPTTWAGSPSNSDLTTIAGLSRQGYTFQTALGQSMGLNHMNGRVQDAITGRFLSADPSIQDPLNGQSYNRYSYVVNNPLTFMDPTGFDTQNCYPATDDEGNVNGAQVCVMVPDLPEAVATAPTCASDPTCTDYGSNPPITPMTPFTTPSNPTGGTPFGQGGQGPNGATGSSSGKVSSFGTAQTPQTKQSSVGCQVGQVAAGAIAGAAGGAVTGGVLGGAEGAETGAYGGALVGAAAAYASQGGFFAGVAAAIGSLIAHTPGGTNLANFTQVNGDIVSGMVGGNAALTIGSGAVFSGLSEAISAAPEGLAEMGPGVAEGLVAGGAGAATGLLVNWGLTAGLHALGCP